MPKHGWEVAGWGFWGRKGPPGAGRNGFGRCRNDFRRCRNGFCRRRNDFYRCRNDFCRCRNDFRRRRNDFCRCRNDFYRRRNDFCRCRNDFRRRRNDFCRRRNGFSRCQNGASRRRNGCFPGLRPGFDGPSRCRRSRPGAPGAPPDTGGARRGKTNAKGGSTRRGAAGEPKHEHLRLHRETISRLMSAADANMAVRAGGVNDFLQKKWTDAGEPAALPLN